MLITLDLGGTHIKGALWGESPEPLAFRQWDTEALKGCEHVMGRLVGAFRELSAAASGPVRSLGVCAPGPLNPRTGVIDTLPNLPGWEKAPLKEDLEQALGVAVAVDNDANAAALGEFQYGAGKGCRNGVCISVGTGLGGGILVDGALLYGADGLAGEIGHMTVEPEGPVCGCGNRGCLEALASATALMKRLAERKSGVDPKGPLKVLLDQGGTVTPKALAEAAEAGEALAVELFSTAGKYLGIGAASLVNILNPEILVITGGLALAGERLLGPCREEMRRRAFPRQGARCTILPGTLGPHSGLFGMRKLGLDALHSPERNRGLSIP